MPFFDPLVKHFFLQIFLRINIKKIIKNKLIYINVLYNIILCLEFCLDIIKKCFILRSNKISKEGENK